MSYFRGADALAKAFAGLLLAAVVSVAFVACNTNGGIPGLSGPPASPTPTPTASPTASPTPAHSAFTGKPRR